MLIYWRIIGGILLPKKLMSPCFSLYEYQRCRLHPHAGAGCVAVREDPWRFWDFWESLETDFGILPGFCWGCLHQPKDSNPECLPIEKSIPQRNSMFHRRNIVVNRWKFKMDSKKIEVVVFQV